MQEGKSECFAFLRDSTDLNGEFRVENVPVGRKNITVSMIGYSTVSVSNLLITGLLQIP